MKNKQKYLVLGDLHGKKEIFDRAVEECIEHNYRLICIGDYTDSFDIPKSSQLALLHRMVEVYDWEWEQGKPVYLIGNHDIHYFGRKWNSFTCMAWSRSKWEFFSPVYGTMIRNDMLQWHFADYQYNLLFTHAGLNAELIAKLLDIDIALVDGVSLESIDNAISELKYDLLAYVMSDRERNNNQLHYDLLDVGRESSHVLLGAGGFVWCRPGEMFDYTHIPQNFKQVVGHTQQDDIIYYPSIRTYVIDNLPEYLTITPSNGIQSKTFN